MSSPSSAGSRDIFYLPRTLLYYAQSPDSETKAVLAVMARKLYRFVTPFMVLATALGLWRLSFQWEYYLSSGWMIAKLAGVVALIVYHFQTGIYVGRVCRGEDDRTHVFYRVFNEVPVLVLVCDCAAGLSAALIERLIPLGCAEAPSLR